MSEPLCSPVTSVLVDEGLRCPRCEYNLTGLTQPRCPECGVEFDWDEVRATADRGPPIAFEQARSRRKVAAFIKTWATALFAPWVFARQVAARAGLRDAMIFAGVCFALTQVAPWSWEIAPVWLTTAAGFVLLQAAWLTVLHPRGWRKLKSTYRLWLIVGCYTSAVMPTEILLGPPMLLLSESINALLGRSNGWYTISFFDRWPRLEFFIFAVQLALWLASVTICYRRVLIVYSGRAARVNLRSVFAAVTLLVLYAASVEYLGQAIGGVLDLLF